MTRCQSRGFPPLSYRQMRAAPCVRSEAAMGSSFSITAFLQSVDQLGQNYVSAAYQALSSAATSGGATSVAGLMLTLYVIFWGVGIWQGTASGGPADHAFRLFRAFVIYALATSW